MAVKALDSNRGADISTDDEIQFSMYQSTNFDTIYSKCLRYY